MEYGIALAQTCHPADGNVLALVEDNLARASQAGASLVVFPECLMSRYEASRGDFLAASEPLDGPFATAVNALAAQFGLWVVYTVNELNPSGLPFNTAVVADDTGTMRGCYRKVHLFDSATTCESERMAPGDALLSPIEAPFGKLGVAICYDLRFPEVARKAALEGCDVLVYPSAWVDGPTKRGQWQALLRARAIENELFVAGVCRADEGYVATSCLYAPDGELLACAGTAPELLVARIETDAIARQRAAIPVFDHRRPELYF